MAHHPIFVSIPLVSLAYRFLSSFPIACFSLTVLTDAAYWQTSNLLWLHFSEWLLFAGLVLGFLAGVVAVFGRLIWRAGPSWLTLAGYAVMLFLAILNSFIHTADGWTAVIPFGIATSIATVAVMGAVALSARRRDAHA